MSFQLRRNLLFSTFIIVIIALVWLLIPALLHSFNLFQAENASPVDNNSVSQQVSYIEKIDNFALQEFDINQQISHFIEAKHYLSFKDSPTLLLNPKVIIYDNQGKAQRTLIAKRANYLDNGDIKFVGKVDVSSVAGITHKINTEELLVGAKTKDLISQKKVTYLAQHGNIVAQGMRLKSKQDQMKLLGKIRINQDSGQKILTKTLYIDESNGQKYYYSKNKTSYLANNNKIYADAMNMDMNTQQLQLLGKVRILQNSGSKINAINLTIDQSKDNEIYRTKEKIHYQSKAADIDAKAMRYDAKNQKIKLSGGVVGRYE